MEFGDDLASLNKCRDADSMAATMTVPTFESVSLPIVMRRAIVLANRDPLEVLSHQPSRPVVCSVSITGPQIDLPDVRTKWTPNGLV